MMRQLISVCVGLVLFGGLHSAAADPVLSGRILNPVTSAEPVAGTRDPSVSGDGRFIFFVSTSFETLATNLGGNQSGFSDVYVSYQISLPQDEIGFDTTLVSRGVGGTTPNGASRNASTSADGRFVAFWSDAENLIANDNNNAPDIFIVDVDGGLLGPTERVSVDSNEAQIPGYSRALTNNAVSTAGRYVVIAADAAIDGAISKTCSFAIAPRELRT